MKKNFFLTLDRSACPQNARAPACAPERAPSVAAACPPPPRMPQHRYPSGSAEIRVCEHVCACGNGQALPALTQTARESPSSSMRPASNSTRLHYPLHAPFSAHQRLLGRSLPPQGEHRSRWGRRVPKPWFARHSNRRKTWSSRQRATWVALSGEAVSTLCFSSVVGHLVLMV